jgi:hypothetical protein
VGKAAERRYNQMWTVLVKAEDEKNEIHAL